MYVSNGRIPCKNSFVYVYVYVYSFVFVYASQILYKNNKNTLTSF